MSLHIAAYAWGFAYLFALPVALAAQTPSRSEPLVDYWSSATLDSLTAGLAAGDSIAAALSPTRPFVHLLLRRVRTGDAELHEDEADLVQIRSGRARLVTGGVLQGQRTEVKVNGELRRLKEDQRAPSRLATLSWCRPAFRTCGSRSARNPLFM